MGLLAAVLAAKDGVCEVDADLRGALGVSHGYLVVMRGKEGIYIDVAGAVGRCCCPGVRSP